MPRLPAQPVSDACYRDAELGVLIVADVGWI
jgi:hypothetical protein